MKSRVDLINRTLQRVCNLGAGQTAEAEDYKRIDDVLDAKLTELQQRSIVSISDPTRIDEDIFLSLADVLAWEFADDFGRGDSATLAARSQIAETRIREMRPGDLGNEPVRACYY